MNNELKQEIKQEEERPLDDSEIKKFLPRVPILTYDQLRNIENIDQIIPEKIGSAVILYLYEKNNGHWVGVNKYADNGKNIIEYFDSLGGKIDNPLSFIPPEKLRSLGVDAPYLTNIIKNSPEYSLVQNNVKFQSQAEDKSTCGRHVCFRALLLKNDRLNLKQYQNFMKNLKDKFHVSYDEVVTIMI